MTPQVVLAVEGRATGAAAVWLLVFVYHGVATSCLQGLKAPRAIWALERTRVRVFVNTVSVQSFLCVERSATLLADEISLGEVEGEMSLQVVALLTGKRTVRAREGLGPTVTHQVAHKCTLPVDRTIAGWSVLRWPQTYQEPGSCSFYDQIIRSFHNFSTMSMPEWIALLYVQQVVTVSHHIHIFVIDKL